MARGILWLIPRLPFIWWEGFRMAASVPRGLKLRVSNIATDPETGIVRIAIQYRQFVFWKGAKWSAGQSARRALLERKRAGEDVDPNQEMNPGFMDILKHAGYQWVEAPVITVGTDQVEGTGSWLFTRERGDEGSIGIAFYSLPIIVLTLPISFILGMYYKFVETHRGMSHYAWPAWKQIRDAIPTRARSIIEQQLKSNWAAYSAATRIVSFEEAKKILNAEILIEERMSPEEAVKWGDGTTFIWANQRQTIAAGSFYGKRDHYVDVLGSRFVDAEADELVKCYKERRLYIDGNLQTGQ